MFTSWLREGVFKVEQPTPAIVRTTAATGSSVYKHGGEIEARPVTYSLVVRGYAGRADIFHQVSILFFSVLSITAYF